MLKKNASLFIALSIPVITTLLIVVSIMIPKYLSKPPQIALLYASNRYEAPSTFQMIGTSVEEIPAAYPSYQANPGPKVVSKLYVYDLKANTSRELTLDQSKKVSWKPIDKLPNNMEVKRGSSDFSFIFAQPNYQQWYLAGQGLAYPLTLSTTADPNSYYDYTIQFLGWTDASELSKLQ